MPKKKLYPLEETLGVPKLTLKQRSKCWFRHHDLQFTSSAVLGSMHWRCRRCTGRFSRVEKETK